MHRLLGVTIAMLLGATTSAYAMDDFWACLGAMGAFDSGKRLSYNGEQLKRAGYSDHEIEDAEHWGFSAHDYDSLRRAGISHWDCRSLQDFLRAYGASEIAAFVRLVGSSATTVMRRRIALHDFERAYAVCRNVDDAIEASYLSAGDFPRFREAYQAGASVSEATDALRSLSSNAQFDEYVARRRNLRSHSEAMDIARDITP